MRASLVAQMVKNPPAMQETWVQSLGPEDPLEKEMISTLVFLPGEPMDREAWMGPAQSGVDVLTRDSRSP